MREWLDQNRLDALREEIGDEDFGEVIALFLCETDAALASLATLGSDRLAAGLHFLRGSALNVGFAAFGAVCRAAEESASAGRHDAIDFTLIRDTYAASKDALARAVGGMS